MTATQSAQSQLRDSLGHELGERLDAGAGALPDPLESLPLRRRSCGAADAHGGRPGTANHCPPGPACVEEIVSGTIECCLSWKSEQSGTGHHHRGIAFVPDGTGGGKYEQPCPGY